MVKYNFEHRAKILLACADSLEEEIISASNRLVKSAFKTYPCCRNKRDS